MLSTDAPPSGSVSLDSSAYSLSVYWNRRKWISDKPPFIPLAPKLIASGDAHSQQIHGFTTAQNVSKSLLFTEGTATTATSIGYLPDNYSHSLNIVMIFEEVDKQSRFVGTHIHGHIF